MPRSRNDLHRPPRMPEAAAGTAAGRAVVSSSPCSADALQIWHADPTGQLGQLYEASAGLIGGSAVGSRDELGIIGSSLSFTQFPMHGREKIALDEATSPAEGRLAWKGHYHDPARVMPGAARQSCQGSEQVRRRSTRPLSKPHLNKGSI